MFHVCHSICTIITTLPVLIVIANFQLKSYTNILNILERVFYLYRLQGKIPFFGNKYFSYKSITTRVLCCYNVILGIFIQVTPFVNIVRQTKQIAPSKPNKLMVCIGWVIYLYPIQVFKR